MKRKGSVFMEAIFYIVFSSIVLSLLFIMVSESMKLYKGIIIKNNLRENAILSENIIKTELKNVKGLKLYKDIEGKRKYMEEGYYKIKKIEYDLIDYGENKVEEGEEGFPKFKLIRKKIEKSMNNLYVGRESKYQIGNYVEAMYIRPNQIDLIKKYDFLIEYNEDGIKYINNFSIAIKQ